MSSITDSYAKLTYKQNPSEELIDISEDLGRFKQEIILQCLREQCQEYSRLYQSEALQVEIRCNCFCHRHITDQYEGEKLVGAHSSVGSPEEHQAVATTNPQQCEGGGNCSNG